ncbi:MAG: MATE family efflux transporter [Alphaproteobacteria bacterium]|nr:MATE family efflux transporter [Alphaproteobacteria bacterium]
MNIQLSDHFSYGKLLRFSFPSIVMVIFTSIYSVVDGLFVANFAGPTPFAAVNIVWPFIMILGAIGFMFGSGGNALVAKTLGEGKKHKARQIFSLLIYTTLAVGAIFSVIGLLLLKSMVGLFGVQGQLFIDCLTYGRILFPAIPFLMLQVIFQSFMVTAERPKFGLTITVVAGLINFALDAWLIIGLRWGLAGAAWATAISQFIGAVVPLMYFALPNKSLLGLGRTRFYASALIKTCTNGISEFLSDISMSLVGMLYNYQLLRLVGESGVIAYGIISYVNFIFLAAFLGYSIGTNPIVSYHFGAQNKTELQNLFGKSLCLIAAAAILLTGLAEITSESIAGIFVGYDEKLTSMTTYGFRIYALSFLLAGFNIYASGFFTALNNGLISAIISVCRTMIFECLCVFILPVFWGLNGIWTAIIVAESLALVVSVTFFKRFRPHYGY